MNDDLSDNVDRFESALEAWGKRPPRTPPEHAATRVLASLPRQAGGRRWWRPVWVAATTLLLAVAVWLVPSRQAPHIAQNGIAPAPLDDNVVMWWLDDETPVYFVLEPSEDSKEGTS